MTKNAIILALFGAGLAMSGAGAHAQPAPQVASIATPAITSMPEDQIGFLSVVIGFQPKADKEVREESRVDSFWRDRVVGWANASLRAGTLVVEVGYAGTAPRERGFTRALAADIARLGEALDASRVEIRGGT